MKSRFCTIILILCASAQLASGQFLGGIFNQNATERKYQLQQIAAIKVYLGYVKQGNDIVHKGASLIGDIRKGQMDLHADYYSSLRAVNPALLRDGKVKAISDIAAFITQSGTSTLKLARTSEIFRPDELSQLQALVGQISNQTAKDLNELTMVISSEKLQMTDDERLAEINRLYLHAQGNYTMQKNLNQAVPGLIQARRQAIQDAKDFRGAQGK